jgi:protein-S-isoprenylcysteine O-methyltransferase Ste14
MRAIAARLRAINHHLMFDLGGGPRPWKAAWVINLQKAGCFPFLAFLMWYYADQTPWATSAAAWTYLALHGSYGLVWAIGWVLILGTSSPDYPLPDNAWFALCTALCILGSILMFGSDAQKYVQLRAKRGLITDGLFRYVRHPNYLGEMMIYGSFALLAWHWLPVLVLGYVWLGLFAVNMVMKEASMSRYPEWAEYKRRSWWLVPGIL